jgi:superfamily II DNA/RNA helicase
MKFETLDINVSQFEAMNLPLELMTALGKMRISTPTAIQSSAIPAALEGRDLIGIAQTGSGKTLAYGLSVLALLEKNPKARALILLPNRETAEQVYRVMMAASAEKPLSNSLVISGIPNATQVSQLKKIPRWIVATPGRLVEHLKTNKLLLQGLEILVLDEADRMLDMGFESQLDFIHSTLRGNRQTLLFAASFGPWAQKIAQLLLKENAVLLRTNAAEKPVETLAQTVFFISHSQKERRLLDELKKTKGSVIVFADDQEGCAKLGRLLEHHKFSSDFMHGDMNPGHRARVLREFREEKIQILVTTDLLARGLDVPHVEQVISFDLPYKADDYLHRIGRTARAGREGKALTFVTPSDERTFRKMKPFLEGAREEKVMTNFSFQTPKKTES